tara:strand:+ start:260 stop:409 length:150 start_codon:yes stop_codon:yes gene_type:complete
MQLKKDFKLGKKLKVCPKTLADGWVLFKRLKKVIIKQKVGLLVLLKRKL